MIERTITVRPSLVAEIGLVEAMVLDVLGQAADRELLVNDAQGVVRERMPWLTGTTTTGTLTALVIRGLVTRTETGVAIVPEPIVQRIDFGFQKALDPLDATINEIWKHYIATFDSRAKLNDTRRRVIRKALRVVMSAHELEPEAARELLKRAVTGLRTSDWHNGHNPSQKKYTDIRYALRGNSQKGESDEDRIHSMAALVEGAAATDAMIDRAKRDILTAAEMPGNAQAQRQAEVARELLAKRGWSVVRDGDNITFAHD